MRPFHVPRPVLWSPLLALFAQLLLAAAAAANTTGGGFPLLQK